MIKIDNHIIKFGKFADGTFHTDIDCGNFMPHTPIVWLYDNDEEMTALWFLTQHCRDHEGYRRDLVMPYLPNARFDRTQLPTDVFTLKYFSQMINALHYDNVTAFDVHSDVSSALFNHIHVLSPAPLIQQLLKKLNITLVAFPDEGSMFRSRGIIKQPAVYGIKERNWQTQKIEQLVLGGEKEQIKGSDILIIDDICGKGTTIYYMATQLKELGAKNVYVYISHCENTVLQPCIKGKSLLDYEGLVTKMYTTNSIFRQNHPKIEIIKEF